METGGYSRGKKCEGQRNDRRLNQEREGRKREGWEGGGGFIEDRMLRMVSRENSTKEQRDVRQLRKT